MSEHVYEDSDMEHERYWVIPQENKHEEVIRCDVCRFKFDTGKHLLCRRFNSIVPDGEFFCKGGQKRDDRT